MRIVAVAAIVAAICCGPKPSPVHEARIENARAFTRRYSQSPLRAWNVRATAAGRDCAVLWVRTSMNMQDSQIESIHYGAGVYEVYRGGVNGFYRDRTYRGVAYQDRGGRIWTYGEVTKGEAETLHTCD